MARTTWGDTTITADANLTPVEANIANWGVGSLANKHTLAKDHLARDLRLYLSDKKGDANTIEDGADGATSRLLVFH